MAGEQIFTVLSVVAEQVCAYDKLEETMPTKNKRTRAGNERKERILTNPDLKSPVTAAAFSPKIPVCSYPLAVAGIKNFRTE